jgi:hypothetical protein
MAKRGLAAFCAVFLTGLLLWVPTIRAAAASSGELLTAVKTAAAQTEKLRSMMADLNEGQFKIVSAQSVLSPGDEPAFEAALKKNASDIADMRDTLTHTTLTSSDGVVMPLSKLLANQNPSVKISQVVAIYVGGNVITIYYQ